jgi:hypothetical protein
MDDSLTPNRAADATPARATEFDRLSRLIERLQDADLLLPEEGAALLDAIEQARGFDHVGDREAAWRHLTRLQRAMEALVHRGRLEEGLGRPNVCRSRVQYSAGGELHPDTEARGRASDRIPRRGPCGERIRQFLDEVYDCCEG